MVKKIILGMIKFYQKRISVGIRPRCKYVPSCSHYTYIAVEEYGVIKGVLYGLWRILRCNPFSEGGFDPVPSRKIKSNKEE